jgi:hypothetical protein
MKAVFEDYYASDANAPSGDGGGEPAGQPKPEAEADDLLG